MTKYSNTIFIIALTQLINYSLPILTFPLLVRAFDINTYGYWIEASTVTQFMIVFGVHGLGNALGAMIVSNPERESMLYGGILYLYSSICTMLMISMFFCAPLLNSLTMNASQGTILLRTVVFVVPIGGFNWLASQIFRLRGRAAIGAVFDISLAFSRLLAVIYAFSDHDILRFALFYVLSQGVITIIQIWVAYQGIPLSQPSWIILKTLMKSGINLSIISQANWLVMLGDRLLLSIFTVSSAVAIYSASYQITLILVALGWPFLYVLLPTLGQHWQAGDIEGAYKLIRANTRIMSVVLIPAVIGLGLTGNALLQLLATDEFAKGGLLVGMIAMGVALDNIGINLQYLFFVQDKSHVLRPIYLSAAAFNIITNLVAIPLFSYYGAGVTTLLTFVYILLRLIKATHTPIHRLFDLETTGKCLLVALVMGVWVQLTVAPNVIRLIVAITGGGLIYLTGVLILGILSLQDLRSLLRRRSSALY